VTTDLGPGAGTIPVTGADPTGAADSSAAIQAAMNAAGKLGSKGGSVYLPPGRYLIDATLAPVSSVRLYGDGRTAAKLLSTTVPVFNMGPATTLQAVEIDHLFLAATNADIFTGANIERSYIHDCELQQNSAGHSIWNSAPGPGLMVEVILVPHPGQWRRPAQGR
jgi:Pectate lyase superfamily protein